MHPHLDVSACSNLVKNASQFTFHITILCKMNLKHQRGVSDKNSIGYSRLCMTYAMRELILNYVTSAASLRSWVYMCYPEALVALGRLGNALKREVSNQLRN